MKLEGELGQPQGRLVVEAAAEEVQPSRGRELIEGTQGRSTRKSSSKKISNK